MWMHGRQAQQKYLAPGEVSTIAASVDTHFEQGHSLSVVTLTTNDPANPSVQLKLEGVIKPQVAAQPMDVDFGSVHHGSAAVRDVVVSDTVGAAGFALSRSRTIAHISK